MSEVIERLERRGFRKRKGGRSNDWEILEQQSVKPRLEEFVKEYKRLEVDKTMSLLLNSGG